MRTMASLRRAAATLFIVQMEKLGHGGDSLVIIRTPLFECWLGLLHIVSEVNRCGYLIV